MFPPLIHVFDFACACLTVIHVSSADYIFRLCNTFFVCGIHFLVWQIYFLMWNACSCSENIFKLCVEVCDFTRMVHQSENRSIIAHQVETFYMHCKHPPGRPKIKIKTIDNAHSKSNTSKRAHCQCITYVCAYIYIYTCIAFS